MTETPKDTILEVNDLKMHFPIVRGFLQRTVGHVKAVDGGSLKLKEKDLPEADISKALKMNNVSQADHDAIMNLNFGLKDEVLAH